MAKFTIQINRNDCIGCGACTVACPKYFEMGADGKAKLRDSSKEASKGVFETEVDDLDTAKDAEEGCPVNAIHISENKSQ